MRAWRQSYPTTRIREAGARGRRNVRAMIKLIVMYGPPKNPEAFDRHYREVHAVLAAKIPGVRRYEWGRTLPGPDGTTPDRYLIAELWYDDADAMASAMASPEGQEAGADLANFADGGVTVYTTEVVQQV